ncbi:MAG: FkbM family methyltransferase [Pseudomonadota bacterium]
MKKFARAAVRNCVKLLDNFAGMVSPSNAGIFGDAIMDGAFATTRQIEHGGIHLKLSCPGPMTHFRARTFSTKEPETLAWIDSLSEGIFWDVGANVGLYSLYAAKRHSGMKVYAFEPSVLNLEILARNIDLNGLENAITIVPLPLTDVTGANRFCLSNVTRGGALSAFGVDYGYDGAKLGVALKYGIYGVTMDDLVAKIGMPVPSAIKMDVDGIEHLILRGGRSTLANPRLRTLLIEINLSFREQRVSCEEILTESGFRLRDRAVADMFKSGEYATTFNTIWVRN